MLMVAINGYWHKIVVPKQCKSKDFFGGTRCQGKEGHDGFCWAYSPVGDLHQWTSDGKKGRALAKKTGIGGSQTPAGHKNYIHPKDKYKEYFRQGTEYVKTNKKVKHDPWDDELDKELEGTGIKTISIGSTHGKPTVSRRRNKSNR